ncbi:serine/threonine-protein kinase 17A isoform X1 [Scophthalmus maximus]|uniref:serine/threonine-protein kinase 17A isoform X1 n=2 Tax=Scophthalmus maximus TaxID=52904 RepID=UPI001FA8B777|nr:serine/threonine-protein kinase 17A isoform X1 [Scophthalmus maximus]XP_035475262.2 serine/threonine-protein kinase 17A isoform X1 [Scophthalmus maximus]XP_035475263.2 serine/threonine-protein kinase 17A isoform X1 [Scophthalmus maximus]XP_047185818.1 serine/threonine-protein kinase 17A isoform X1 [Scophthalmus maximus]
MSAPPPTESTTPIGQPACQSTQAAMVTDSTAAAAAVAARFVNDNDDDDDGVMIPECPRAGDPRSRASRFLCAAAAAEPSPNTSTSTSTSSNRSASGLLREIQTGISKEPFTDHYTIIPGRELGRGKFAVVRKCVEKRTGHEYAAKFMRKRRKGQDCRMDIIHEIAVLELATVNQRVVNLHQVYEMASEMVLVLEFAAGGEIFNQCVSDREEEAFSEEDVKRLMRQILEGVAFLHQRNIVHLDLKPQNILLTCSSPLGDIKIVDFGLSRMVCSHQELREIMGTPEYVAPEILNYEPISTATDMWSIGVLAYVMLTGISPFLGEDKQETFLNISQLNVSYTEEELQHLDPAALTFIQTLLRKQPQDRATAEQCLTHPWLQSSSSQETQTEEEVLPAEDQEVSTTTTTTGSHESPSGTTTADKEEKEDEGLPVTEELIVVAAYTLGQCRQSSTSEKEALVAEQKAISKRFKFEEPFSALQEVPGEFIY